MNKLHHECSNFIFYNELLGQCRSFYDVSDMNYGRCQVKLVKYQRRLKQKLIFNSDTTQSFGYLKNSPMDFENYEIILESEKFYIA